MILEKYQRNLFLFDLWYLFIALKIWNSSGKRITFGLLFIFLILHFFIRLDYVTLLKVISDNKEETKKKKTQQINT